ncbi:MAG: helix-turn-helix transcriptional regulator, partial [Nocardioidaceae bacterium]
MTTLQADTFAAFVDSLASHLDDHDARGEDLAARVHLSRFHFDRVVSATAGETPSRFRRRLLLERSAYRLATTAMGVLDVAVEAGFSSNEAFTRAFQRAYGVAPSAWRSRPHQPHLESPNGVHFHPPGGLRLPPRKKVTSMDLVLRMIEHHVWLIEEMIDRAATLPDASLDAPIDISVEGIDDRPTVRSLLSRLVGQMDMWNCAIAMRDYDWDVENNEALDSLRARLGSVAPVFVGQVRDVIDHGRLD